MSNIDRLGLEQRYKINSQKVLGCRARSYLHPLDQGQS